MANATKYIEVLIDSLTKFPGIGRKGAERIAYFIVKSDKSLGKNLIGAIDRTGLISSPPRRTNPAQTTSSVGFRQLNKS